jgi:hypothetical protein
MSLADDPKRHSPVAFSKQAERHTGAQETPEAVEQSTGSTPGHALGKSQTPEFKFGKRWVSVSGTPAEVFTLTFAGETIELLPLKNWSQLDAYKWRARGQLPGTPTGLEIALDHLKFGGEEFYPGDTKRARTWRSGLPSGSRWSRNGWRW